MIYFDPNICSGLLVTLIFADDLQNKDSAVGREDKWMKEDDEDMMVDELRI